MRKNKLSKLRGFLSKIMVIFAIIYHLALIHRSMSQSCKHHRSVYGFALVDHDYKSFTADRLATCYSACNTQLTCQQILSTRFVSSTTTPSISEPIIIRRKQPLYMLTTQILVSNVWEVRYSSIIESFLPCFCSVTDNTATEYFKMR